MHKVYFRRDMKVLVCRNWWIQRNMEHFFSLWRLEHLKANDIWLPQVCTSCKAHYAFVQLYNCVVLDSSRDFQQDLNKDTMGGGIGVGKIKNFFKRDKWKSLYRKNQKIVPKNGTKISRFTFLILDVDIDDVYKDFFLNILKSSLASNKKPPQT